MSSNEIKDAKPSPNPSPKSGILDIAAYVGGKSIIEGIAEPIKLSSNENALGASAMAMSAYDGVRTKLFRYPDGHAGPLREAVSAYHGLEPDRLIFGNGSDEIFALLNQTYLEVGDNIVTGEHGFLAYRISALACQADVRLAFEPNLRIDVDLLLEKVDARTKIVYISNPGNPTGSYISLDEIRHLRENLAPSIILVIDEAYAEFVDEPDWQSGFDMARGLNNMLVTRTFSKIHGLAGLRVGFAYASLDMVRAMERVRMPFNLNLAAQSAAVAALKDTAHIKASKAQVINWHPRMMQDVRGMGLIIQKSVGNFILIDFLSPQRAQAANEHLMKAGIIVRYVANYGLPNCLRVTIGTDEQNRIFLDALRLFRD